MTTQTLTAAQARDFDYAIVGGGTAGCVIASRLAEYLPDKKILLVEAGPSDYMNDEVLLLKDWLSLLGGELDYGYRTTEQKMGKLSFSGYLHHELTMLRQFIHISFSGKGSWRLLITQYPNFIPAF